MAGDESAWLLASLRVQGFEAAGAEGFHQAYYNRPLWLFVLAILPGVTDNAFLLLPWMLLFAAINTALITFSTRTMFGDDRAAMLAGLLYAIHPISVQYDVLGLPDSLGVTVLLTSLFFASRFLRGNHTLDLFLAASLVGLSYGFKQYFPLLILPYAITLVDFKSSRNLVLQRCGLMVLGFMIAVTAVVCLRACMPHGSIAIDQYSNYSALLSTKDGQHVVVRDVRSLLSNVCIRALYVDWLATRAGLVVGTATLFGSFLFLARSRTDRRARFVFASALFLFSFLAFCPAPSWPFVFVEMQRRYLTVLVPFMCLMGGVAVAHAYSVVPDRKIRFGLMCFLVVGSFLTMHAPNDARTRNYSQFKIACIRESARQVAQEPNMKLVVSEKFAIKLPLALGEHRDIVEYAVIPDAASFADISAMTQRWGPHFYVYLESSDAFSPDELALNENGLAITEMAITVPHTSFRRLLDRLGIPVPGRFDGTLLQVTHTDSVRHSGLNETQPNNLGAAQ